MVRVEPSDATLGAVVTGVDLAAPLEEATWRSIEQAFHEHAVLVFPGQHLNDDEQIAFSKNFGNLERLFTDRTDNVAIAPISNVDSKKKTVIPEGSKYDLLLKGNTFWHTDSSFRRVPAKASLLSARELPSHGGETEFADMRAAWDALDARERAGLEGLVAIHDYRYSQGLVGGLEFLTEEEWSALPPVPHPIVAVHPATGRKSLYIGRHAREIVGMEVAEGKALLDRLLEGACQPPRTFLHRWSPGDLVAWDNRCVLHRGYEWDRREARVMHRTTVAGDGENEWALEEGQPVPSPPAARESRRFGS